MIDWRPFREAFAAGLPNADRVALLRKMEGWLGLDPQVASAALDAELARADARSLYQNLIVLNLALQREAGISAGAEAGPALQKLFSECAAGSASADQMRLVARLSVLYRLAEILVQKDATITQRPSPAELAKSQLQQAATAIFKRIQPAAKQVAPGLVTPEIIGTLESALREAEELIQDAAADNGGLPYVFFMTGSTARMLARCYALTGRNDEATATYARSADCFEKAGEPGEAQDARDRAGELQRLLATDLDTAAARPLEDLASGADSWKQIQAAMRLSSIAGTAGDTFEALTHAETAARQLTGLGYRDPSRCGVESAMESWLETAMATSKGIPLLGRVSEVSIFYDSILGARFAVAVAKDPPAADALYNLQVELQKLCARMREQTALAEQESAREIARYFPPLPVAEQPKAPTGPDFETLMDRMRNVDLALAKIRQVCNQRVQTQQPMDDLLAEVEKLEAESDTLNSPEYAAKTRLERAYILFQLGRGAELGPVSRDARGRLLAGRPSSLSSLANSDQRYLYLDSLKREVMGCIMTGDFEGALALCTGTIRDFESARYRVASEYRQAALLSFVADFYTWAAFSAFQLQRWDDMLEAIDLIKARSAIRSRLIPDRPADSELLREFDEVDQALARQPADENLRNRRRELWDLLSIARGQGGESAEVPTLTVAALQNALAEDEALIGYFWLSASVILAVAVDRRTFHAERIALKPGEVAFLNEFVSFIQALKSSHNMDRAIARLGAILIPGFLREFMKSKKRIVFSPHHSLHLVPFHAARWETGGYIGTEFAVRYVPNFSSVLLPWTRRVENRVLAVGIRAFADPAVQPLENVEEDASAAAAFYRANGAAVDMLIGRDASRDRIKALRGEGPPRTLRCAHFGTHGLSVFETPDQPLESRLLVQDGALDAMDIANLRMGAELVMLSACHSGQRSIDLRNLGVVPGDDIFGLQAAFFKSGVRSIVGTLWLVETKSSSPITRAFHKHFAEAKPAEVALQLAIREYLEEAPPERRGAYYWAPYFVCSIGAPPSGKEREEQKWWN